MNRVTKGVAIPSLRPLSTLSARRIRVGTDLLVTTANPSAVSVGARIVAINAAAAHGISGNTRWATSAPARIVSGSPTNSSRVGRPASPSTSRSRTVEASENSSRASVNSVTVRTTSLVTDSGRTFSPAGPRTAPAATNTIGPEIHQRSSFDATSVYATTTTARAVRPPIGSPLPRRPIARHRTESPPRADPRGHDPDSNVPAPQPRAPRSAGGRRHRYPITRRTRCPHDSTKPLPHLRESRRPDSRVSSALTPP